MQVGSTNMTMTLPVEMSYIVQSCEGYVLEYVGDAIIAFFPSGYPELRVKIGLDEGENVIVPYGHGKTWPIDILGYCMSISTKITLTDLNRITI